MCATIRISLKGNTVSTTRQIVKDMAASSATVRQFAVVKLMMRGECVTFFCCPQVAKRKVFYMNQFSQIFIFLLMKMLQFVCNAKFHIYFPILFYLNDNKALYLLL